MTNNRIMGVLRRAACLLLVTMWLSLSVEAAQMDVGVEYFSGKVGVNVDPSSLDTAFQVKSSATTQVGAEFAAITGQTANLTNWKSSAGVNNTFIDKDGVLNAANIRLTGTVALPSGTTMGVSSLTSLGAGVASALGTAATGTGAIVLANSPVLTTPNLGTPSAINLTNATSLPIGAISGLGSGVATFLGANMGTGVGTFLTTPTSANLASAVTNETGSGALVFGTSPQLGGTVTFATGTTVNFANATVQNLPTSAITPALSSASSIGGSSAGLMLAGNNITTTVLGPLVMALSDIPAISNTQLAIPTTAMIQLVYTAGVTDITLAADPIPVSASAGQILIVTGKAGNTAKIKLLDNGTPTSKLNLATPSVSIGVDSVLVLISNGSKWIEVSRSLN